jgi:hypothetical protein
MQLIDPLFVPQFKYLETTVTNQNFIQGEIKRILNSGNACYRSVQNILPFRLLSKHLKLRIYKSIILPVVLYGCWTWPLTLGEEHKLRLFENMLLRIFGRKRDEVIGGVRVIFEKLTVPQFGKKFPAFHWNPCLCHRVYKTLVCLSYMNKIYTLKFLFFYNPFQVYPPHPTPINSLKWTIYFLAFELKSRNTRMFGACSTYLILFNLTSLIVIYEEYKFRSKSLRNYLLPCVTSSLMRLILYLTNEREEFRNAHVHCWKTSFHEWDRYF